MSAPSGREHPPTGGAAARAEGRRVVDVIYVAACDIDSRFTRICIASIRRFYPSIPIRLLVGAPLVRGLARELSTYWDVGVADIPPGDYSWGYVKMEALFGKAGERFLVLDSDTVMTGPILDRLAGFDAPFLVDDEPLPDDVARLFYYDWDKLNAAGFGPTPRPAFLFNSGQWIGTAGVLARADFDDWLEWSMPRQLRRPQFFKAGDQGVLNFIINRKVEREGLQVDRCRIMQCPFNSLDGIDAGTVARGAGESLIVHWAGIKKLRQREMLAADLLAFYEQVYYRRLPLGFARRWYDIWRA